MNSSTIYSSFSLVLLILLNTRKLVDASVIYYAKADVEDKHRKYVSFKVYQETDDYDYLKKGNTLELN